jgi:release factor glutamine methyltransferase
MTYSEAVARAAERLAAAGFAVADAEADAAVLARHILNWDLGRWLLNMRERAEPSFVAALDRAAGRRAAREPVAYITGTREFYGRPFLVSPAVLIPRPETELIVELALEWVQGCTGAQVHGCKIADVGTGSGCLATTLALELPGSQVVATDISSAAIDVARKNAAMLGAGERIEFREGSFFAGSPTLFDVIVSNPPYVAERDRATLQTDVVDFEPPTALFAGGDGLACVRELVRLAPEHLRPDGRLMFEFGFGQADAVSALIRSSRLIFVAIHNDLQGIPRVAVATV